MAKGIRERLLEQAIKFHQWQEATYPGKTSEELGGEWEVDYPYLYLGEREKALQTAERLATSRLWAVAGPTQVRPMSFFEDPNLREFLMEPESLRRIREAAFIDDGSLIRK